MARLIRTEKEVEGRFEEVWLVVEEDALEQWPAGPLDVVGRPAPRVDGPERARGEATLHRRHPAARDAPRGRPALPARARARDADRPRAGARGAGRARRDRPGRHRRPDRRAAATRARPSPPSAPTRSTQAARRVARDRRRVGGARAAARRRRGGRARLAPRRPRESERGDVERGLAEADVVVEATYRTQVVLHNSMETHQSVCRWVGDDARGLHLDAVRLGRPRRAGGGARHCPPTTSASSATTWAAASARRTARTTTRSSPPSSRGAPAARPLRADARARRTSPPATATRRSSAWSPAPAPTGR